jgi:hypothetical protein
MVGYVGNAPTQQLMLLIYSQSHVFSGIISRKYIRLEPRISSYYVYNTL